MKFQRVHMPSLVLFAVLFAVIIVTFRAYGPVWDDLVHSLYGELVYQYYASGFTNREATWFHNLYLYGGFFEGSAAALSRLLPWGLYDDRHFCSAISAFLGLIGVWKLGAVLSGKRVAFWSVLLTLSIPFFFGQMFVNSKDIPFAAGYAWTLYFIVKLVRSWPRAAWRDVIPFSISLGLTLGVRIGGVLLVGYLVLVLGTRMLIDVRRRRFVLRDWRQFVPGCVRTGIGLFIAYLLMLVCWPWAQQNPVVCPLLSLKRMSDFNWAGDVLFGGVRIPASELPRDYLFRQLLFQLPEILIVLLVVGVGFVAVRIWRRNRAGVTLEHGLLLFALAFPLLHITVTNPTLYDTIRHVTFLLPLLALAAAWAYAEALTRLSKRRLARLALPAAVIGCLISVWWRMLILFPYQYAFYNEFAGGLRHAGTRYETEFWGQSYKEAVERLVAHVEQTVPDAEERIIRVKVMGPEHAAKYYFPANFRLESRRRRADYGIHMMRFFYNEFPDEPTLFTVGRQGIPFTRVVAFRGHGGANP